MSASDTIDYDSIDLERTDSRVIIEVPATEKKHLGDGRTFESEGEYVKTRHLDLSLVNIDAWFDPDYANRLPDTVDRSHYDVKTEYILHKSDINIRFDVWPDELRKAARKRAIEDSTSTVRVLAGWLWQAGGTSDNIERGTIAPFYTALRDEVEESDETLPSWALCYDGDPENWHHDEDPVTTLDEAADYKRGGMKHVLECREDDDE